MAKYKNIEEYRLKKKRKRFTVNLVAVLLIAAVLFLVVYSFNEIRGKKVVPAALDSAADAESLFPIIIKNEQMLGLFSLGNDIGVLSKSHISLFSQSGKRGERIAHGYSNPVVRQSEKCVLTYDRGGVALRVDYPSKKSQELKLDNSIILANISSNGYVAVVSTDERYACVITVYDNSLDEVFQYFVTERVTNVCFAPDNQHILATEITTIDGLLSANFYQLNINDNDDIKQFSIKDILPIQVKYTNSNIEIVGKDSAVYYDINTGNQTKYEYYGDLIDYSCNPATTSVFVTQNYKNMYSTVYMTDKAGTLITSAEVDDEVINVYAQDTNVFVLGKKYCYVFDGSMALQNKITLDKDFQQMNFNNGSIYFMGIDRLEKVALK